ncbi:hypothetical protein PSTT_01772 [Puccinia striiformis]|uniref:Uncharacterized protein n=1 Tax=Puccinia striiformis TaxID=27350 RepID=A0A2S4W2B2_9BASI|nr:hypothetical protein PSTT_01772 [Puccinia striiformis]
MLMIGNLLKEDYAGEGFDGCVGSIDGSLIPLFDAPSKNGSELLIFGCARASMWLLHF